MNTLLIIVAAVAVPAFVGHVIALVIADNRDHRRFLAELAKTGPGHPTM